MYVVCRIAEGMRGHMAPDSTLESIAAYTYTQHNENNPYQHSCTEPSAESSKTSAVKLQLQSCLMMMTSPTIWHMQLRC